jgi:hypothetical protein
MIFRRVSVVEVNLLVQARMRFKRAEYVLSDICQPGTSVHTVHCELHLT